MVARLAEARGGDAFWRAGRNLWADAATEGLLRRKAKGRNGTSSGRART